MPFFRVEDVAVEFEVVDPEQKRLVAVALLEVELHVCVLHLTDEVLHVLVGGEFVVVAVVDLHSLLDLAEVVAWGLF